MPKGKYTRKQASHMAIEDMTGEILSPTISFEEIKKYVAALLEDLRERCRLRYRQNMFIGRPNRVPVQSNDFAN